mmetsp:Transcript_20988/g.33512  ORF Transcript_20988/g.33512 Transcript_20988/m.33512 type:complete len:795 (-) Transcript_20988:350-2734(-)
MDPINNTPYDSHAWNMNEYNHFDDGSGEVGGSTYQPEPFKFNLADDDTQFGLPPLSREYRANHHYHPLPPNHQFPVIDPPPFPATTTTTAPRGGAPEAATASTSISTSTSTTSSSDYHSSHSMPRVITDGGFADPFRSGSSHTFPPTPTPSQYRATKHMVDDNKNSKHNLNYLDSHLPIISHERESRSMYAAATAEPHHVFTHAHNDRNSNRNNGLHAHHKHSQFMTMPPINTDQGSLTDEHTLVSTSNSRQSPSNSASPKHGPMSQSQSTHALNANNSSNQNVMPPMNMAMNPMMAMNGMHDAMNPMNMNMNPMMNMMNMMKMNQMLNHPMMNMMNMMSMMGMNMNPMMMNQMKAMMNNNMNGTTNSNNNEMYSGCANQPAPKSSHKQKTHEPAMPGSSVNVIESSNSAKQSVPDLPAIQSAVPTISDENNVPLNVINVSPPAIPQNAATRSETKTERKSNHEEDEEQDDEDDDDDDDEDDDYARTEDEEDDDEEDDDLSDHVEVSSNRKRRKSVYLNASRNSNNARNKQKNQQKGKKKYNGKRGLGDFMANNDDAALSMEPSYGEYGVDGEYYPEVGIRATTTVQLSKTLFAGQSADLYLSIAQEMLLRAVRQIAEYRWMHEKYRITQENIRYVCFLNEELKIPKEFEQRKPKRGRPPKHKKPKVDELALKDMREWNMNASNDKIYRVNFQIIFEYGISEQIRHEIVQCIKIDLNQNSLSLLFSNVLSAKVAITDNVQSYSLYAVDAAKLKEYEKYEREEEARKKKKREREQKRRESKKKGSGKSQSPVDSN